MGNASTVLAIASAVSSPAIPVLPLIELAMATSLLFEITTFVSVLI
ncbi:MAG: hypothetical protein J6T96_05635 [Bacteroidales bacterium]|nr:hypothetical protein [Bacteroidales bacterium]